MNLPATIQIQVDPEGDLTQIELETIYGIMNEACFKLEKLTHYVRAEMYLGEENWHPNVWPEFKIKKK